VSIAAFVALASAGCWDDESLSDINTSETRGLAGVQTANVVLEPSLETIMLRPSANPERNAYYGDLHVHTEYSFDAFAFGSLATPRDAYRYAKGEAIPHPAGYEIQLRRPLDFYAVTDHAMFLGVAREAADTGSELSRLPISEELHDFNAPDNRGLPSLILRGRIFGTIVPEIVQGILSGEIDRAMVDHITRTAWLDSIDAADEASLHHLRGLRVHVSYR
jgi:hypothetical protein